MQYDKANYKLCFMLASRMEQVKGTVDVEHLNVITPLNAVLATFSIWITEIGLLIALLYNYYSHGFSMLMTYT